MIVFTIGYEGLNIETFMSLLAEHRIETVVDVRELPLSRKRGFSKKALASTVTDAGLRYVHMVDLGCPKDVRNRYREDSDWKLYTRNFQKYLKTRNSDIDTLCEQVRLSRCALLCFEADFSLCHRSMVANAVRARCGATVTHICTAVARTRPLEDRRAAAAWVDRSD